MKKIKLRKIKPTEKKEIKRILRRKNNNKLTERARIIALANADHSIQKIAEILDRDIRTIRQWIKRFNTEGIAGLYDRPRSGCPEKKGRFRDNVLETMRKNPLELGEAFASWTLEDLHKHVNSQGNDSISISTVRRILYEAGWKCRSLKSLYKSNAPSQEEKEARLVEVAEEILGDAEELPPNHEILTLDESHWDLRPRRGRVWTPPEFEQVDIDIPENKADAFTVFGALNLYSGKFIYKIAPWGYATTFKAFLYQIESHYRGKEIHIILDKASIHTAGIIEEFLERHPNIHLHFLLPRGSEVNPIERFWRYCKDQIKKGASFQCLPELYHAVRRFFFRYSNGAYRYRCRVTLEKLAGRA